ncbi:hypothetical protein OESDEN_07450 [Oesophagostomum dentatum]|uniref:Uncharacterized protein n=1 Tax=Oesophagostomum dentatum TaxID=61180 RepID=A0A0B1T551_OESDE|nr:hypothetical protein OESDEN_07450 [Oesophagostomum dentatum]
MLHKNLKVLKRSISEKLLGNKPQPQKVDVAAPVSERQSSSLQSSQDEEDPYREILRTYNDNVSHLVFHGSSLKSMSSIDFGSLNQSAPGNSSCRVRFDENEEIVKGRPRKAMNA